LTKNGLTNVPEVALKGYEHYMQEWFNNTSGRIGQSPREQLDSHAAEALGVWGFANKVSTFGISLRMGDNW
jgi:hypothetical protein